MIKKIYKFRYIIRTDMKKVLHQVENCNIHYCISIFLWWLLRSKCFDRVKVLVVCAKIKIQCSILFETYTFYSFIYFISISQERKAVLMALYRTLETGVKEEGIFKPNTYIRVDSTKGPPGCQVVVLNS